MFASLFTSIIDNPNVNSRNTTFLLISYISDAKLQLILENKKSFGAYFFGNIL